MKYSYFRFKSFLVPRTSIYGGQHLQPVCHEKNPSQRLRDSIVHEMEAAAASARETFAHQKFGQRVRRQGAPTACISSYASYQKLSTSIRENAIFLLWPFFHARLRLKIVIEILKIRKLKKKHNLRRHASELAP